MKWLADLPVDHPLRTSPLIDIHAIYRHYGERKSHPVMPTWKIAGSCYNDLGCAWTKFAEWGVEE